MGTELEARATLAQLAVNRDRAVDLYREGLAKLFEACAMHRAAAPGNDSLTYLPDDFRYVLNGGNPERSMNEFAARQRAAVDRDAWRSVLLTSGIWDYLDEEEHRRMEASFKDTPPEFSPENVRATLERLQQDVGNIFRRGLIKAFESLSRDYKSNDGFKIGTRMVVEYVVEAWGSGYSINVGRQDKLRDVDKAMHLLDGKKLPPSYQEGLCAALREAIREGRQEVETPYWRVRWFKNGNAHLWATNQEVLDKANLVLAGHYGAVLGGNGKKGDPFARPAPEPADDLGDYPSPPPVVALVMEYARIEPGMTVLEPSAGAGNLASAAAEAGGVVTCIEVQDQHVAALRASGLYEMAGPGGPGAHHRVVQYDFLATDPDVQYHKVVMNPPFARGAAVRHVQHALKYLMPGGRLVSVMPAGWRWNTDHLHEAFRQLLDNAGSYRDTRCTYRYHTVPLPPGSFKASGTMVNTELLVVVKGDDR